MGQRAHAHAGVHTSSRSRSVCVSATCTDGTKILIMSYNSQLLAVCWLNWRLSHTRRTSKGSKGPFSSERPHTQVCVLCCCCMVGFAPSFQSSCSSLSDWGLCSLPQELQSGQKGLRCFFCFSLLGLEVNPPGFLATSGLWRVPETLDGCVSFLERALHIIVDVIDGAGSVHVVTDISFPSHVLVPLP